MNDTITTENKRIELEGEGIAQAVKANFRREIINIIKEAPNFNEKDPETEAFINLWVSETWEEFTQGTDQGKIKLRSKGGSDNIW